MVRQPLVELMTTEEVATALTISTRTVLRWIHAGIFPAIKLGEGRGAEWRIRRQDLERYLAAHLRTGESNRDTCFRGNIVR